MICANSNILDTIVQNKRVGVANKTRKYVYVSYNWTNCKTLEFDFNNDALVDLVVAHEDAPDEAGDSVDTTFYYNVNGTWVKRLKYRSHANP
ncbi:MAG: hypothetical protein JXB49_30450 [Bacteroidales bacterium]|nr:hypothetical protein [Bacteroidales bacterium]